MDNNTIEFLKIPLPEEIAAMKAYGDFKKAEEMIEYRLKNDISMAMKKRLEIEKEILKILPKVYIYSYEEALSMLKENVKDFKEEELLAYQQDGSADWILVDGKPHFQDRFFQSLVKTKKEIAARVLQEETEEEQLRAQKLLDDNVKAMKEKGGRTFHIHLKTGIKLKKEAIEKGNILHVHLPLPKNAKQTKNIEILSAFPKEKSISDADADQRTIYFEEVVSDENCTFTVEYSYDNHVDYVKLSASDVSTEQPSFHTEEQAPHIMFTPYLKELALEILEGETNPVLKARKFYDFITTKINYIFMREYFTIDNIPEYAAVNMKGDCGVQALLFITLCRLSGIPAKWQSGMFVTPYTIGNHDWAQFYIAPYGWLFADLSFGGSAYRKGAMERWDYYFGNIDPFRMPANSEFQKGFVPDKKHLRIDPYDNQRGECEYENRGLRPEEFEVIRERLEMKEL